MRVEGPKNCFTVRFRDICFLLSTPPAPRGGVGEGGCERPLTTPTRSFSSSHPESTGHHSRAPASITDSKHAWVQENLGKKKGASGEHVKPSVLVCSLATCATKSPPMRASHGRMVAMSGKWFFFDLINSPLPEVFSLEGGKRW